MCGIAGLVLDEPAKLPSGVDFLEALAHRGPDDAGKLVWGDRVWLFHRRLSILDPTPGGRQPMSTSDGRLTIVFNGEIYNFLELRAELKGLGHRFRSQSDTEVLLAAWAEWGKDSIQRLMGMFAFAIFDTRERTLYLVRDFFGIKPLYYCRFNGGFAFASEIRPLLRLPGVSRRVSPEQVYRYLRFGLTDDGEKTLFADVYQVPAAHFLRINLDTLEVSSPTRYWRLDLGEPSSLSFQDAAEKLRELFLESVRLHLRSDVPVGSALSGGIDSSAIVMAMRYLEPGLELHTFSYVADDPSVSEEAWVDLVGRAARACVHKVRLTPQELVADLDRLVEVQGEPFGSTSIYAQYRVFRLVRETGIKVVLDGQGGDELLGGYVPYTAARVASLVRSGRLREALELLGRASQQPGRKGLWRQVLSHLLPASLQPLARRVARQGLTPSWLRWQWFADRGVIPTLPRPRYRQQHLRHELLHTLTHTSLPQLLRYEDRNSMAHSVESRVPFLTPRLAEFVFSLPEDYIVAPDGTTKAVFRAAMRGIVPDAILGRRDKVGFATPEQRWLKELFPWVERQLSPSTLELVPVLDPEGVRREWQAVLSGKRPFDFRVWRWLNLLAWGRVFEVEFQ